VDDQTARPYVKHTDVRPEGDFRLIVRGRSSLGGAAFFRSITSHLD